MKKVLSWLFVCLFSVGLFLVYYFTAGGLSAYELAVRNGYKGTETQWLESLKGNNGQNGEDGVSYEDIRKLYEECVAKGEYSGTFLDFVKEYVKVYDAGYEVVANHCLLSSVSVSAYYTVNNYLAGSGIIYDIDEVSNTVYIVTNYHVVYVYQNSGVSNNIKINLYGSESLSQEISCQFLGGSEAFDLAVLKVSGAEAQKIINSNAEEIEVGEYFDYTIGEGIIAIGNPEAKGITVVSGIVSADNRYIEYSISNKNYYHRVFQIDAPVNSGNSGGGIFDSDGKLVGIASSKYASSYSSSGLNVVEGMAYGIPLNHVVAVADYCIANCNGFTKTNCMAYKFGVTVSGANSEAVYNTSKHRTEIVEDVAITNIDDNFIGKKMGLAVGDLIKKIKITKTDKVLEYEITRVFMVTDLIRLLEEGDAVEIQIENLSGSKTCSYTISSIDSLYLNSYENFANN